MSHLRDFHLTALMANLINVHNDDKGELIKCLLLDIFIHKNTFQILARPMLFGGVKDSNMM